MMTRPELVTLQERLVQQQAQFQTGLLETQGALKLLALILAQSEEPPAAATPDPPPAADGQ